MELQRPGERFPLLERREIFSPPKRTELANTYVTRSEPVSLLVNGARGDWHSMKGGRVASPQGRPQHTAIFEVLYNPDTFQWLKVAPPETGLADPAKTTHRRLLNAAKIARTAFELADLPQLANQTMDSIVERDGDRAYGFVSPHIGPTVEFLLRVLRNDHQKRAADFPKFFGDVYTEAFHQAADLCFEYGYLQSDPNPGNIALHKNNEEDTYHVVLLDFANSKPIGSLYYQQIPQDTSTEAYQQRWVDSIKKHLTEYVDSLSMKQTSIYDSLSLLTPHGIYLEFKSVLPHMSCLPSSTFKI